MVKHTQTILRLLPTNCLSVFDHFVGLALKGLKKPWRSTANWSISMGNPLNPFLKDVCTLCNAQVFISRNFWSVVYSRCFLKSSWNFKLTLGPSIPICKRSLLSRSTSFPFWKKRFSNSSMPQCPTNTDRQ